MDNIIIPASITLENSNLRRKYNWKSDSNKFTIYNITSKRAFVRFSCKEFSYKLNKLSINKRKINVKFRDNENIEINRNEGGNISIQGYSGKHPHIQFIVNKALPKILKKKFLKNSHTFPINVKINLNEWSDLNLKPSDFIIQVEKDAKSLLDISLNKGFKILKASKGREFDLNLINSNNKEIIIALSSHIAKNQSRSKEKSIQKILMDICKMLPYLYENKKVIPVVITRPIDFEKSWSFTTKKYLDFYKQKFGFIFLTTEFKKGWEDDIIGELSKI